MTVLAKPVWLFFQECTFPFFLTRSLIDMCQIMTDTCKNNVSKFVRKPFKSPLSYSLRTWKCFGEASLFNLHHLYFNYHLPAQNIAQFMEDPAVITALNHSGCFGRNLVQFKEKIKMLFTSLSQSARGRGLANNIYLFDATSATPKPT